MQQQTLNGSLGDSEIILEKPRSLPLPENTAVSEEKLRFPVLKPSNIYENNDGAATTSLVYLVTSCNRLQASECKAKICVFASSYNWSYNDF